MTSSPDPALITSLPEPLQMKSFPPPEWIVLSPEPTPIKSFADDPMTVQSRPYPTDENTQNRLPPSVAVA